MSRKSLRRTRKGSTTLDYIMVLAVVFPLAFAMLQLMVTAFKAIHEFIAATVGWPIL